MTHRIIFHRQLSAISPINSESDGIGLNQGAGGGAGLRIARSYPTLARTGLTLPLQRGAQWMDLPIFRTN